MAGHQQRERIRELGLSGLYCLLPNSWAFRMSSLAHLTAPGGRLSAPFREVLGVRPQVKTVDTQVS